MNDGDSGLGILLDLDGESFVVDEAGNYTVRFVVKQVPASPERPHGLSYSLTLHDDNGVRIVGFDNAHVAQSRKRRGKHATRDHWHRLLNFRPYEYRDAATLLADFWAEVHAVLKERGIFP